MSAVIGYTGVDIINKQFTFATTHKCSTHFAQQQFNSSIDNNYYVKEDGRFKIALYGNITPYFHFHAHWQDLQISDLVSNSSAIVKLFASLNGIYAFSIFDIIEQKIYLCADPLGFYPLYYYLNETQLIWSSEQKIIFQCTEKKLSLNPQAIDSYLLNGHLLANQSWFKEVKRIPAGQLLCYNCKNQSIHLTQVWSWSHIIKTNYSFQKYVDDYKNAIQEAIHKLDLPNKEIGLSLSGGLDSRLLVSIALEKFNLNTFTFSESNTRDLIIAKQVAAQVKVPHQHFLIDTENLITKREQAFYEADGMLNLEHIHEGGLHNDFGREFPIYFNGFYGGGIYASKKLLNQKINLQIAQNTFFGKEADFQLDKSYYDFPSIDPFIVDHKLRNQSAMSLYLLSKYCKIIIPFYNLNWLSVNYSMDETFQLNHKLYFTVLNKYLCCKLNEIPWQKTMIPLKYQFANELALALRWPGIQLKLYNSFHKTINFINYQKLRAHYHEPELKELQSHPALLKLNPIQKFWRISSLYLWKKYLQK